MQSQNEYNSVSSQSSTFSRVWQFIRFVVITGMIFAISFFAMNFQAYKSILASVLNPEAQEARAEVLEAAVAEPQLDESLLLPILEDESSKSYDWLDFPVLPTDNRLVIPKLGKSVPLVGMGTEHLEGENWSELENQIQDALRDGVVHYPGTASPGQNGNVFITGHSSYYAWDSGEFKDVFALLGQLEIGEEYYVYYEQKKYTYRIIEKVVVDPTDVSVLHQPEDKKISTLMTCYPVGTTRSRLVIRAEQV